MCALGSVRPCFTLSRSRFYRRGLVTLMTVVAAMSLLTCGFTAPALCCQVGLVLAGMPSLWDLTCTSAAGWPGRCTASIDQREPHRTSAVQRSGAGARCGDCVSSEEGQWKRSDEHDGRGGLHVRCCRCGTCGRLRTEETLLLLNGGDCRRCETARYASRC